MRRIGWRWSGWAHPGRTSEAGRRMRWSKPGARSRSFEDIAVMDPATVTLSGPEGAERIGVARVSPNFFPLLGIRALEGRLLTDDDATQRRRLALISHEFWQERFGGSLEAIGASLVLDGAASQIVGVLPPGLLGRRPGRLGAAHPVSGLGGAADSAQRRFVVRFRPVASGRERRTGRSRSQRDRPDARPGRPGRRSHPRRQRHAAEPLHRRRHPAAGLVAARRRGVLRAARRRGQCRRTVAGAGGQPHSRDGDSGHTGCDTRPHRPPVAG